MKNMMLMRIFSAACVVAAAVFASLGTNALPPDCGLQSGIDFHITTDRLTYAPGATMLVKFLVVNRGEAPLFVSRELGLCSSITGFATIDILDSNNREVQDSYCAADSVLLKATEIVQAVSNTDLWFRLKPGEIYGHEESFDLPKKKGTYRLKATLKPFGYSGDEYVEILHQKGIKVVESPCPAPVVTITVK